jgi:hypothetical protein
MADGSGYLWAGPLLAPLVFLGIRWLAKRIERAIPEGRLKRALTKQRGDKMPTID